MRVLAGVAALAFLLGSCHIQPAAGAAPLSADERAAIELASVLEKQLASLRARTVLSKSQRAELDARLGDVRAALAKVERLREQGRSQSVVLGRIGVFAGGLMADDATGVGVADDDRNTGGTQGYSICRDCFARCKGQGAWPESISEGMDCRWWRY